MEPDSATGERTRVSPSTGDPEGIAQLRAALEGAGYTDATVRAALDTEVSASRESAELPLYRRMLPEGEPLSTLIELFLLGVSVDARDAAAALAPLELERVEAMGLLTVTDDRVQPAVEIVPTNELLVACDSFREELDEPDHVLGVSPPARVLAALTVRREVDAALDLGTGNGIQALLAARHARRVVAVDINARALDYARFNAALNGAPAVELVRGDMFDPVVGSEFDLIVCNPPYVISPETEFTYRDSGFPGDSFCEGLVRRLPSHLREGGFAHVLVSWLHGREQDWEEPLRAWLQDSGCDALLLRYATHAPLDYAAGWNRPARDDPVAYADALDRWTGYLERLGAEAVSWGAIILRRSSGRNWIWGYTPPSDRITGASDHVLRLFDAHDFLAGLASNESLLDRVLKLAPDHRLDQTGRIEEGIRVVERTVLRLAEGLRFEVAVDPGTVEVLALVDGRRPLRDVLVDAARSAPASMTLDQFVESALPVVRRLIELGFLVPAEATAGQ